MSAASVPLLAVFLMMWNSLICGTQTFNNCALPLGQPSWCRRLTTSLKRSLRHATGLAHGRYQPSMNRPGGTRGDGFICKI